MSLIREMEVYLDQSRQEFKDSQTSVYIQRQITHVKSTVELSIDSVKAHLHSKSRHAWLRHEHLRHACLGCLHINVFVHVSSISRHLPLTNCKQRLRSNNGE